MRAPDTGNGEPSPRSNQGAQSGAKAGRGKEKTRDKALTAQGQDPAPRSQGWRHKHPQFGQGVGTLGLSLSRAPGPWVGVPGGASQGNSDLLAHSGTFIHSNI